MERICNKKSYWSSTFESEHDQTNRCYVPCARFNSAINLKMTIFRNLIPNTCWHLCPSGKEFYRPRLKVWEVKRNSRVQCNSHTLYLSQEVCNIQRKKRSHWMKWTTLRQFPSRQLVSSFTTEAHVSVVTVRRSIWRVNRVDVSTRRNIVEIY